MGNKGSLTDSRSSSSTIISQSEKLLIVGADYGDLAVPQQTVPVAGTLQGLVDSSGGYELYIPAGSCSSLPAFSDKAPGKKKELRVKVKNDLLDWQDQSVVAEDRGVKVFASGKLKVSFEDGGKVKVITVDESSWLWISKLPVPKKGIHVIRAFWGDPTNMYSKGVEVTSKIRELLLLESGMALVMSNKQDKNKLFGDPVRGVDKSLEVHFYCDGQRRFQRCDEYSPLYIASSVYLNPQLRTNLAKETYFDSEELQLLYENFVGISGGDVLTATTFVKIFPAFNNELVIRSLFHSMDQNSDQTLDFPEYARMFSVMSRGTPQEKADLAFKICDFGHKGFVSMEDATLIMRSLLEVMSKQEEEFAVSEHDFQETVQKLFRKRPTPSTTQQQPALSFHTDEDPKTTVDIQEYEPETQEAASEEENRQTLSGLTRAEFLKRAATDQQISSCFGMFSFFYFQSVYPIELKLFREGDTSLEGRLKKEKGAGLAKSIAIFGTTDDRWFQLRDGFLAYYRDKEAKDPVNVICLSDASVKESEQNGFILNANGFSRQIFASSRVEQKQWINAIRQNSRIGSALTNRFGSFAPVRYDISCRPFINGVEYYGALAEVLKRAKKRVYITDWYFSPELYLRRQQSLNPLDRLDNLLAHIASRGVSVYIIVWNASSLGFDLQPKLVCDRMNAIAPNIYAIAHPYMSPVYWSHHQKTVIVDEEVAFVGGLDLCYGRYDDDRYLITDPLSSTFAGRDYNNLNYGTESNGPWSAVMFDRMKYPRMPWHDVHMQLNGPAAGDVAFNFIQRWNLALKTVPPGPKQLPFVMPLPRDSAQTVRTNSGHHRHGIHALIGDKLKRHHSLGSGADLKAAPPGDSVLLPEEKGTPDCKVQILRSVCFWSAGVITTEKSIYTGYIQAIAHAEKYILIENQYFIGSIRRSIPENKIVNAIYERVSRAIRNQETFRVIVILPVYPAGDTMSPSTQYIIKYGYKTINRQGDSLIELLQIAHPNVNLDDYVSFHCLRNYGNLKYLLERATVEQLVNDKLPADTAGVLVNAKPASDTTPAPMSSAPGTGGGASLPTGSLLTTVASVYSAQQMVQQTANVLGSDQISIIREADQVVTEQVYIHTKMMIVDDRIAIIGSANINDRSMNGDRDSEIAAFVENDTLVDGVMNGQTYKVGPFALALRQRLFAHYLGLQPSDPQLNDPISDKTYHGLFKGIANKNTQIYSAAFTCMPENTFTIAELQKRKENGERLRPECAGMLKGLRGYLVNFPLDFLKVDHDLLSPAVTSVEYLVPKHVFL